MREKHRTESSQEYGASGNRGIDPTGPMFLLEKIGDDISNNRERRLKCLLVGKHRLAPYRTKTRYYTNGAAPMHPIHIGLNRSTAP